MSKNWANEIDSYKKDFDAAGKTKADITDWSTFRQNIFSGQLVRGKSGIGLKEFSQIRGSDDKRLKQI